MDASRPASALPAGPVPPRMPIRIDAALHNASLIQLGQRTDVTTITDMGLLDGKNIVITGVLTDASLAFGVAKLAQEEGREHRADRRRPGIEPHRTSRPQASGPCRRLRARCHCARASRQRRVLRSTTKWGESMAFCIRSVSLQRRASATTSWRRRGATFRLHCTSAPYSFKALADAFAPLMTNGGSFVGLDFDNSVAWPAYNWMGVSKSALESISRYLAVALGGRGIRRTSLPPVRSRRWRPRASRASRSSKMSGTIAPHWGGT